MNETFGQKHFIVGLFGYRSEFNMCVWHVVHYIQIFFNHAAELPTAVQQHICMMYVT